MKQRCIECGKIFYVTDDNMTGYPQAFYDNHKNEYKIPSYYQNNLHLFQKKLLKKNR